MEESAMQNNQSAFIIFKTEDEKISVDVRFEDDTVWLSQEQVAQLFGKARTTITEHIQNIFKEGELTEEVVCRNIRLTTGHGTIKGKTQEVSVRLYNEKAGPPFLAWLPFSGRCFSLLQIPKPQGSFLPRSLKRWRPSLRPVWIGSTG